MIMVMYKHVRFGRVICVLYPSAILITITFQCCFMRKRFMDSVHSRHIQMHNLPYYHVVFAFLFSLFVPTKMYVSISFCFSSSEYLNTIPMQLVMTATGPLTITTCHNSTTTQPTTPIKPTKSTINHNTLVTPSDYARLPNQKITLQLCARQTLRLIVQTSANCTLRIKCQCQSFVHDKPKVNRRIWNWRVCSSDTSLPLNSFKAQS